MKKLLTAVMAVCMFLSLSACGKKQETAESKQVLSVMFGGGTPLSLDPALNSASTGSNTIRISHCGLMGYNNDGELIDQLAQKHEVSEDGMTYTFTLRSGLKWSDGSDFSASDVLNSWKRAASSELGADYGFLYDIIEGNDGAGNMNVVVDDAAGTIVVKLAYAAPYFLDLCAFPTFFPVKTDLADAEGIWAINPETNIGMGAFKMVSYAADDVIVYEKNPYYWDAENISLDGINAYLAEDNVAILTAYENGTVQLINSIDPTEFARLKNDYGNEFQIADLMGTWYILFNVHKDLSPAGKQLSVQEQSQARYALGLFINRVELVENVTQGGQTPATGFYPSGLSDGLNSNVRDSEDYKTWYTGTNTVSSINSAYTEDQVEACKILMDLGYGYTGSLENGDLKFTDVPSVEFSFNNAGANKAIIEYVQEVWNTFGITAVINQDAWSTLQTELKQGNAEAARMGWVADYNDVTNFIEIFISSSGNNYPRLGRDLGTYAKASDTTKEAGLGAYWGLEGNQTWAEAFDALDDAIKFETDMAKRAQLASQAEQVLMATGAAAPIYFYTNPLMISSKVSNISALSTGDININYATFK